MKRVDAYRNIPQLANKCRQRGEMRQIITAIGDQQQPQFGQTVMIRQPANALFDLRIVAPGQKAVMLIAPGF